MCAAVVSHSQGDQMRYTLAGDRKFEYGYANANLPVGKGRVLDVGPTIKAPMSRLAVQRGYTDVVAIGLGDSAVAFEHPNFTFVVADLVTLHMKRKYNWILNISSIEHFGLAGRYGVTIRNDNADLQGMAKLQTLMWPHSKMLLTIPIGMDSVIKHYHRVYGRERLPQLLDGYHILNEQFWAKTKKDDVYRPVTKQIALNAIPITGPPNYYALGAFTLELQYE